MTRSEDFIDEARKRYINGGMGLSVTEAILDVCKYYGDIREEEVLARQREIEQCEDGCYALTYAAKRTTNAEKKLARVKDVVGSSLSYSDINELRKDLKEALSDS